MMTRRLVGWACALLAGSAAAEVRTTQALGAPPAQLQEWEARIDREAAAGRLSLRTTDADTVLPGRSHQRFQQRHQGVPVFGGELVRQTDGRQTLSVFGSLYEDIDVDARPVLTAEDAKRAIEALSGVRLGPALDAELVVLPHPNGSGYALTWTLQVATARDSRCYFVDARSGQLVYDYSDLQSSSAVGTGLGTWGDPKKLSTDAESSAQNTAYVLWDRLRPANLRTYDMKGNLQKVLDAFNGFPTITLADQGRDTDNQWADPTLVDAHVYQGYTYDYFFKRFGRRGLDDRNGAIFGLVHPVNRAEYASYPLEFWGTFFANASYRGQGVILYGDGLPAAATGGQGYEAFSAGLDIVAHELTHGVTRYSSNLTYSGESGALNEAFSDIMGTSVEFFFEPTGAGRLKAEWLIGEDVAPPAGLRSLEDPARLADPDHYSKRYLGSGDNGGVHINSGIANHAFYLAVEGGTNRTSGQAVQGVGFANREQIEKAFYRAFVYMLTPSSDFKQARAATIQAAREQYGASSPAERAVTQAWSAVGVQ